MNIKRVAPLAMAVLISACGSKGLQFSELYSGVLTKDDEGLTSLEIKQDFIPFTANTTCKTDPSKQCMAWGLLLNHSKEKEGMTIPCQSSLEHVIEPNKRRSIYKPHQISYQWSFNLKPEVKSSLVRFETPEKVEGSIETIDISCTYTTMVDKEETTLSIEHRTIIQY